MTIGQLETFLAVARTGSVHGAAALRVVSDASVSAAVASLERELGGPLIERHGRGVRLTAAGEALARHAAEALGLLEQGREAARTAMHPGHGRLRLGAVNTAGEYVLPQLIKAFRQRAPNVEVSLQIGNRANLVAWVRSREVDLGIGGRPPSGSGVSGVPVLPNDLYVVAATDHGLARARDVAPGQLAEEVWLLREEGSGTRATTLELFAALGIRPERLLTLGSNGAVKQGALVGLGVTLLSEQAAAVELRAGLLRRLDISGLPLHRPWHVWYPEHGGPAAEGTDPPGRVFTDFLRSPGTQRATRRLAPRSPNASSGRRR